MITIDSKESAALARRLGGDNYIRMPQADGTFVIIMKTDNEKIVSRYNAEKVESVYDIDWEGISNTPDGKRMTGKLGKSEKIENDDSRTIVAEIIHIATDADLDIKKESMEQAVKETSTRSPECDEDYELLINRRISRLALILEQKGFVVNRLVKKTKLVIREGVEWLIWSEGITMEDITDINM